MRRIAIAAILSASLSGGAVAQPVIDGAPPQEKKAANPCSDEVAAALRKLRNASWFTMSSNMITENGPSTMVVDYILPDRMHQTVTNTLTKKSSEIILIGREAWSRQGGEGAWTALPAHVAGQLQTQMEETVLQQQSDVGAYSCNGRIKLDGREVMSYKLESTPGQGDTFKNQTYRMFYVDVMTGLPVSNALLVPGRDDKPIFKTTYNFPLDLKIDPPKDVAAPAPAPAPAEAPSAAPATPEPPK